MISRKYVDDYKISETVLPDGRIKKEAVYVGGDYTFAAGADELQRTRKICLVLTIVCWAALIGALLPVSRASRLMYVLLPHVCCFLPLAFLSGSVRNLWRAPLAMTRERADKISEGLPINALLCLLFSGAATLGFAAAAVMSPEAMMAGDGTFGLFSATLTGASTAIFMRRNSVRTMKT